VEPETLWILALAVAAPISGVIGFSIQLRQVTKARLENEKLQLEIGALRHKAAEAECRIVQPSTDEVLRISRSPQASRGGGALFSRSGGHEPSTHRRRSTTETLINVALVSVLVVFVGYLIYDLYRLAMWASSKL
jgi:hypothetical protein